MIAPLGSFNEYKMKNAIANSNEPRRSDNDVMNGKAELSGFSFFCHILSTTTYDVYNKIDT